MSPHKSELWLFYTMALFCSVGYIFLGSTNTGLALEVARKDMFIPESGDRPSVPNFLLLVTDGQSDEPQYTIEQARLIQDQGKLYFNNFIVFLNYHILSSSFRPSYLNSNIIFGLLDFNVLLSYSHLR